MKAICMLIFLLAVNAQARTVKKCGSEAMAYAYEIYQTQCNGAGSKKDCTGKHVVKQGALHSAISCYFSGEPDYNDALELDLVLDLKDCRILNENIKDCYSD